LRPGLTLSPALENAINAREKVGGSLPKVGGKNVLGQTRYEGTGDVVYDRIKFDEDGNIDFNSFKNDPTFIITGVDLTQSQDWVSSVKRSFNFLAGQTGISESGYAGEPGEITSKADTQLKTLARKIMGGRSRGLLGRWFKNRCWRKRCSCCSA